MNGGGVISLLARIKFEIMLVARWLVQRPESDIFSPTDEPRRSFISAIYVINLDRQKKRWRNYLREACFVSIRGTGDLIDVTQRFSAIDARNPRSAEVAATDIIDSYSLSDQYFVEPDERLLPFVGDSDRLIQMSPQEIAVASSHIGVWRRLVEERRSYALILEDDIYFDKRFTTITNDLWREIFGLNEPRRSFDILYLSYREPQQGATKAYIGDHTFRPIRGLWQLSGYVLSYEGAQKLLALLPLKGPVDLWLNLQFDKLDVLAASSSVIHQRFDWKSDNSYSIIDVLRRLGIETHQGKAWLVRRRAGQPVFGLGLSDPQASSLCSALSLLGYRVCDVRLETNDAARLWRHNDARLFDAFVRLPEGDDELAAIDGLFPGARYIAAASPTEGSEPAAVRTDLQHPERPLLRLDFGSDDPWQRLCEFLDCPIPDMEFPSPRPQAAQRAPASATPLMDTPWTTASLVALDRLPWILPHRCHFGGFAPLGGVDRDLFAGSSIDDDFDHFDRRRWNLLENSFPANLAYFDTRNFGLRKEGGFRMTMRAQRAYDRDYTSASLCSVAEYLYGRFEAEMKPARSSGAISALFLHRFYPRQEIDIEFLGEDTTRLLTNVFYNPGVEGTSCNLGDRGVPVSIELGFDAADEFHRYAIEWGPHEIRWLVDGRPVHRRYLWGPSPIPDLPMKFFMNLWSCRHPKFGGRLKPRFLPLHVDVRRVRITGFTDESVLRGEGSHEHSFL